MDRRCSASRARVTAPVLFGILGLLLLGSGGGATSAQSPRCPAFPSFPDASCTGTLPGVSRGSSGSITTSSQGQIIENLNISGSITVVHNNVTIRNVKITNPRGVAINNSGQTTGMVIEDCELDGTGNTGAESAVGLTNYTLRRCNIHHFGEGPGAFGNATLEDNYMHDFLNFVAGGAHQDGIQAEFGSNVTIRHNTCLQNVNGANSCFQIGDHGDSNILVEQNLVAGGSFTMSVGSQTAIKNNRISTAYFPNGGYFGPIATYGGGVTKCGNRWQDGPQAGQLLSGEAACSGSTTPPPPPAAPLNVRVIR